MHWHRGVAWTSCASGLAALAFGLIACRAPTATVEECAVEADCAAGRLCVGGLCLRVCNAASQCPSAAYDCIEGTCQPIPDARCQRDADCPGAGEACQAGRCVLDDDSCDDLPEGTVQTRERYAASEVSFDQQCLAETQTRSCADGAFGPWSGTFLAETCVVLERQDCGLVMDGAIERLACYDAAVVPEGELCTSTEQSRQCAGGAFAPDWPQCANVSCQVAGHPSCGAVPHGNGETRRCFDAAMVPFGSACTFVEQVRTCKDGVWNPDFAPCSFLSCTVEGAEGCSGTPHGGDVTRACFDAPSVPYGSTCTATTQTRTCDDGAWLPDWPACANLNCMVEPPADACGATPSGEQEGRACYQSDTVPYGETCTFAWQTRTCDHGVWSPDWPTCTVFSCAPAPGASCGAVPDGGGEARYCYASAVVAYGSTCASTLQTRTCDNGAFNPDYPACAHTTCALAPPASCGSAPHGSTESRQCYAAASVPHGSTCSASTQLRTCSDGTWSPDWPTCVNLTCAVEGAASCGATPSGGSESRSCFAAASVPYGATCSASTQTRTCVDGQYAPDYPSCDHLSCALSPPASCGATAHGGQESRSCYASASVPFGASCTPTTQTRTCSNGAWSPDWPSCSYFTCSVAAPASCGATAHGVTETRRCYVADSVPYGSTCAYATQSRSCYDGAWSPDYPACAHLTCAVQGAASCGATPSGGSESRQCYTSATVPYGSPCSSTAQTRTCSNGAWSPDYPACAYLSCTVGAPASCGATPSGGSESRQCYASATVPYGSPCSSTTQARTCSNGSWSPDYGACAYLSCSVSAPASCGATAHGGSESRQCYTSATVPSGSTCSSTTQTRTCSNGTWSPDYGSCAYLSCTVSQPRVVVCRECVLGAEEGPPSNWCGGLDLTGCVFVRSVRVGDDACQETLDANEITQSCP